MLRKLRALFVAGILGAVLGGVAASLLVAIADGLGAVFHELPEMLSNVGLMGGFAGVTYALFLMGVGKLSGRIRLNTLGGAALGTVSTALGVVLWATLFDRLSSTDWLGVSFEILPIGAVVGGLIGAAFRHADPPNLSPVADDRAELRSGSRSNSA